ncbi:MAG: Holliday junction branch migration protein RuvA [Verrucomicrobiota bacterium]
MIARIRGTIIEASPLLVIIETGGLGYEINIPITTAERLPRIGEECALFTHSVYREDSATLYGFATREDRDFFRLLVEKVSGIGPKIGISILSRMSVQLLRGAIARSDVALLSKCPGIGKKTAERLVIELKDKVAPGGGSVSSNSEGAGQTGATLSEEPNAFEDAVSSLVALGYKPAEADKLVRRASAKIGDEATVEELLRASFT